MDMAEVCTFTGHRILRDLDFSLLDRVIKNLIKGGCRKFLCGMAVGFDLAAAESVLQLSKVYGGELVACVPCADQNKVFSVADRTRYERILGRCSEVIYLAERYYKGCMHVRDRFMVDNSDAVVCYLRERRGGTFYTVEYARKQGKMIIEI